MFAILSNCFFPKLYPTRILVDNSMAIPAIKTTSCVELINALAARALLLYLDKSAKHKNPVIVDNSLEPVKGSARCSTCLLGWLIQFFFIILIISRLCHHSLPESILLAGFTARNI